MSSTCHNSYYCICNVKSKEDYKPCSKVGSRKSVANVFTAILLLRSGVVTMHAVLGIDFNEASSTTAAQRRKGNPALL